MPTTREDVLSWRGQTMVDAEGDKIGSIEEIYLDAETNEPEWALVSTGMFGSKQSFVPINDAGASTDGVRVAYTKAMVKDAPKVDPDGRLSHEEEAELYRHYGREYGDMAQGSGLGTTGTTDTDVNRGERGGPGRDVSGPNTDDAMTL